MHHLAIMNKKWKLIPKILSGQKTIESRWYMTRRSPWNKISAGDTIYFKDAGESVTAFATVENVLQFENYSKQELKTILKTYGGSGGICFANPTGAFDWCHNKKYCILIFLKNPKNIQPFEIDKTGFGNACAWITLKSISTIKIKTP